MQLKHNPLSPFALVVHCSLLSPIRSPSALEAPISTASVPLPRSLWLRPKYLLVALLGMVFTYMMIHNEAFLVNSRDPVWHRYLLFKWWLLAHVAVGASTFVVAPMQFSERLRQRYRKLHRVSGRIYVASAFVVQSNGVPENLCTQTCP